MKVVIIEDEPIGARRLKRLLLQVSPGSEVVATLESVVEAKTWMESVDLGSIDLFFSDIQLADGLAFDIFEDTTVPVPIIFTTAYDEYALRAFRYNGIAYLLKPVQEEELRQALEKFHRERTLYTAHQMENLLERMDQFRLQTTPYTTFICYRNDKIIPVTCERVACFFIRHGVVFAATETDEYMLDESLDEIEAALPPALFFRISRQCIIQRQYIVNARTYPGNRLAVTLSIAVPDDIVVSRERVPSFKKWLAGHL
jgi:two-component system response regulator LytT